MHQRAFSFAPILKSDIDPDGYLEFAELSRADRRNAKPHSVGRGDRQLAVLDVKRPVPSEDGVQVDAGSVFKFLLGHLDVFGLLKLASPAALWFELIGEVNIRNLPRNRIGTDPVKI